MDHKRALVLARLVENLALNVGKYSMLRRSIQNLYMFRPFIIIIRHVCVFAMSGWGRESGSTMCIVLF